MKIADVIRNVDVWQPNVFALDEKLRWCYEVTADILMDCPVYRSVTVDILHDGAAIPLPDGVLFSHVARIYLNGKPQEIRDERTLPDAKLKKGDVVNVVYRDVPKEYVLDEDGNVPENLETVCPAPFDAMYIDYVAAQIAFQQNDLDDYDKFISRYNSRFEAYKKYFGSNSPVSDRKTFVNLY